MKQTPKKPPYFSYALAAALVALPLSAVLLLAAPAVKSQQDQGFTAVKIKHDAAALRLDDRLWAKAPPSTIKLMAQPMIAPRPKLALTEDLQVQALHDNRTIAFRLSWKDEDQSEAGRLGEFSDAVALEFPAMADAQPPSPFMGEKGKPVHIYHWRAQYQKDALLGHKPEMRELYPNLSVDAYPMEYKDPEMPRGSKAMRRIYSPGQAAGNPQAYRKAPVDEIFAEGFGTSAVAPPQGARALSRWRAGRWEVVITRPIRPERGSVLRPGGKHPLCFAVWQGGKQEVGSRKSLTLMWTELKLQS